MPAIYSEVLQLRGKGYLESKTARGHRLAEKAVYSVADKGGEYFERLRLLYRALLAWLDTFV